MTGFTKQELEVFRNVSARPGGGRRMPNDERSGKRDEEDTSRHGIK